jgi:diaminopimelate decarboxylase
LVEELRDVGVHTLRNVDVGGGLGIRYTSETPLDPHAFAAAVQPLAETTGLEIAVEPGRFIVGNAGLLLTRCLYRKRMGKVFVIVDAAMNDFLRASLYEAVHDIAVVGRTTKGGGSGELVDVVGPVCESGDFLGLDRDLPEAEPGALLAVAGAGAYGFTMSSTYNSRPRVAEVLIDGEQWATIRERESVDDMMRGERTIEEIDSNGAWVQ